MNKEKRSNGFGISSLVLSLLGLMLFWFPLVGLVLSILSVIFAVKQRKINSNGITTSGLVMGIIGIVISGIYSIIVVAFILG